MKRVIHKKYHPLLTPSQNNRNNKRNKMSSSLKGKRKTLIHGMKKPRWDCPVGRQDSEGSPTIQTIDTPDKPKTNSNNFPRLITTIPDYRQMLTFTFCAPKFRGKCSEMQSRAEQITKRYEWVSSILFITTIREVHLFNPHRSAAPRRSLQAGGGGVFTSPPSNSAPNCRSEKRKKKRSSKIMRNYSVIFCHR